MSPEEERAVPDALTQSACATCAMPAGGLSAVQWLCVWKVVFWPLRVTVAVCPCLAWNGQPQQLSPDLTDTVLAGPPAQMLGAKIIIVSVVALATSFDYL